MPANTRRALDLIGEAYAAQAAGQASRATELLAHANQQCGEATVSTVMDSISRGSIPRPGTPEYGQYVAGIEARFHQALNDPNWRSQPAPAPAGPRSYVTQGQMGFGQSLFHWTMIVFTCGLWLPVYLSKRRKLRSVTRPRY
jgi:hypothetical protein